MDCSLSTRTPKPFSVELLSSRLGRETETAMANDSNNQPCVKVAGALLRPGLHHPSKGVEEGLWLCDGEASDLCKNSSGAEGLHTHHWRTTVQTDLCFRYNVEFE